jgi:RecA/RadA recombinase
MSDDLLKELTSSLKSEYASVADDSDYADVKDWIDTGSYIFNALCSGSIFGGIPSNKITALAGEASAGKTFFLLSIINNFLRTNPEALVFYFESEGAVSKSVLEERGIDTKRVIIAPVKSIEDFKTQAVRLIDSYQASSKSKKLFVALDSLGMLPTEKEVVDAQDGHNVSDMSKARLIKSTFRILSLKYSIANVPLVLTNHTYQTIGMFSTKVSGGGSGLQYAASQVFFLSKSKEKESEEVVGNKVKITINKSRFTKEHETGSTLLHHKTGLNKYYGLLELAVEAGIFTKSGKKYEISPGGEKFFEKEFHNSGEEIFTQEILEKIDTFAKSKFKYGS